ncbi:hypothetical protein [Haloarcula amylovorans]|uniref:hypothetical protein n=1 Tax=Haloarcula amylovorans TaxID=2562280 RepID=UPI001430525C|nr:hypothetical protein [Halomicroarcula amylolytica]
MRDESGEYRLSSDQETISDWAEEHDAVPVRHRGADEESGRIRIVSRDQLSDDHEKMTWDEFHSGIEERDSVVVYRGTGHDEPFEVTERSAAIQESSLEDEAVEEALLEGETVTTEVTETTVVERTVVEEAEIQSEVIDRELVEENVVGAELRSREFDCDVTGLDSHDDDFGSTETDASTADTESHFDTARFESGYQWDEPVGVEVDVEEEWLLTKEVTERLTIESEVVGMDITESETVEEDAVEQEIDVEGVQQNVLDSGIVDVDVSTMELIESGSIESEYDEDDVVHTYLFERETIEEGVTIEKHYAGDVTGETTDASTGRSEVVESRIIGGDEVEFEMATVVDTETGVETDLESEEDTDMTAETETSTRETTTGTDADVGGAGAATTTPSDDDEGKTVYDASGDKVGMVVDVEGDTLYVDPDSSITDKFKSALGWDVEEDDAQPIPATRIARITDRQIELVDEMSEVR